MLVTTAAWGENVTRNGTWTGVDSNVTPVVARAVSSAVAVDDRTSVITEVEAGNVFPVLVIVLVRFPIVTTLLVGVMVNGGITELYIDVMTIVVVLLKVEAALVVVWLKKKRLVDVPVLIDGGGVVVKVVVK
jgi:hypothetical protein